MDASDWKLRPARTDELATLVAIDDDACTLYADAGRDVELPREHDAFMRAEQARWKEALDAGRVVVAVTAEDAPIGFVSLGLVDDAAHVQQLSVRRAWMRRGIGRALMDHAISSWRGAVWLTTYADLEWNRPYYERLGFSCVDEGSCGPEIRQILHDERRALPEPGQRVAMVRRVGISPT